MWTTRVNKLSSFISLMTSLYFSKQPFLTDPTPPPGCLHVNTSTHRLVDGYHRERYFHGVNVVIKGPPWMPHVDGGFNPFWSFVDEDMELLYENGLNAIRFGGEC